MLATRIQKVNQHETLPERPTASVLVYVLCDFWLLTLIWIAQRKLSLFIARQKLTLALHCNDGVKVIGSMVIWLAMCLKDSVGIIFLFKWVHQIHLQVCIMQDKYFDESVPSLNNSVQHMHSTTG